MWLAFGVAALLFVVFVGLPRRLEDGDPGLPPGGFVKLGRVERWRGVVLAEFERRIFLDFTAAHVLGLIHQESGGNEKAVSGADAYGLMQLKRVAWQDFHEMSGEPLLTWSDAKTDPASNVRVGMWYLKTKVKEMGGLRDGLRAYNVGAQGAKNDKQAGARYASNVLDLAREYA